MTEFSIPKLITDRDYIQQYAEELLTDRNFKLAVIKRLLNEVFPPTPNQLNDSIYEDQIDMEISYNPVIATANLEKLLEECFTDETFQLLYSLRIASMSQIFEELNEEKEESVLSLGLPAGSFKINSTTDIEETKYLVFHLCLIFTTYQLKRKVSSLKLSPKEMRRLLGVKATVNLALFPSTRLFQDGEFEAFPTSAPFSTWYRAAPYAHKWKEEGIHYKQFSQGRFVKIQIVGTDVRTGQETILEGTPAWNIIKLLNWDTLKLNLILLMFALKARGNSFIVQGTDILAILNNRRTDLTLESKLTHLKKQFELLRMQSIKVRWSLENHSLDCNPAVESSGIDDLLMWIIPKIKYQSTPKKELIVKVTPGEVFSLFCMNDDQVNNQISYLPKEIIELDSYKYGMEISIGVYTILEYRIRRNKHHRIETIVRQTIPPDEIEAALSDRTKGSRLKKRILQCFDFYKSIKWSVTLSFPDGSFSDFLKGTVDIIPRSPTSELQSQLESGTQPKPETPKLQPALKDSDSGNWLREARTGRKWSMAQLANYSGVDKSVISRIEQGKRNATPETMVKLRQALESGS